MISYQATLKSSGLNDGRIIDRKTEFKFRVGLEEAALCIDKAVRKMRVGSQAEVVCVPDHLMANTKAPVSQIKSSVQIIYKVDLKKLTKADNPN